MSHSRLDDLAQVADACRNAFLATAASSHWQPAVGSAASEAKRLASLQDPATSSSDVMAGFDLVSEVVVTYLEVAAGHLAGLAALYRTGEAMFPPVPLVRSIIENCASLFWVLGAGAPTVNILARAYLAEYSSCEFAKTAAARVGSKNTDAYRHAQRRSVVVRDHAMAAFPGATKQGLSEEKPGRTLAGETLPGLEESVANMFDLLHIRAAGTVTERQARGIYSFLSGGTHPSLYQARQMRVPIEHGDHHGTYLSLEIAHVEKIALTAILAYYNALSYCISFYGLDGAPHEALTDSIDLAFPGIWEEN